VLALQDHYQKELVSESEPVHELNTSTNTDSQKPDAWAIKYIDAIRLQAISEAIDDNASGFINIGEMNRFTNSRPPGWR
jgi:hypothetical protein